jgi:hypothetical protein
MVPLHIRNKSKVVARVELIALPLATLTERRQAMPQLQEAA